MSPLPASTQSVPAPASRAPWITRLLLVAVGLHLVFAFWNIFFNGQNPDEGFYALAARSVWEGDLPYRDFGYTQMPLLPYINGLLLQGLGHGLFEQRMVNGLWAALTVVLAASWLTKRTSPGWGLGFAVLLSLSVPWMSFVHLGKTYALAGLLIMAAWWVYSGARPGVKKMSLLALLATLGIGCRLTVAPFFAVLWVAAAAELPRRSMREWMRAGGASLLWPLVLLLPFYLVAPEQAYFWTMEFHRVSVPNKPWHIPWWAIAALAPAAWVGAGFAWAHGLLRKTRPARDETVLLLATLPTLAANLLPSGVFEEYGVPLLPPLLLLTALGLWRAGQSLVWLRHPLVPAGLLVVNLALTACLLWPNNPPERRSGLSLLLPLNAMPYDPSLPERIARQTAVVKASLPAGEPFIGPNLILAAEAERPVPRVLRMGTFTATMDYSAEKARRLNLATFEEIEAHLRDSRVPFVAFHKSANQNYAWSMPSFATAPRAMHVRWLEILRRDFSVVYEDSDSLLLVRNRSSASSAP